MLYDRSMQTVGWKAPTLSIHGSMRRSGQGRTSISAFSIGAAHHVLAKVLLSDRHEDAGFFIPNPNTIHPRDRT
jgi:hypothetical protein